MTLYAVQDGYGGTTLMLTEAAEPVYALDAYAVREGFAPYSQLEEPDEYLYTTSGGLLGAVFTNSEIVAVPVVEPVRYSIGMAGVAVIDANDNVITDAHDTEEEARAYVLAAGVELEGLRG